MYLFLHKFLQCNQLLCGYFTFHNVSISTEEGSDRCGTAKIFTFHNVSISTCIIRPAILIVPSFTFHNVSISTLEPICSVIGEIVFTFHNVSISTTYDANDMSCSATLHSTMYLFLLPSRRIRQRWAILYIPQCIYFYSYARVVPVLVRSLHSTMYLFLPGSPVRASSTMLPLHSTMYLFLLRTHRQFSCPWSTFTFHNVSISTWWYMFLCTLSSLYIPQCIYFYPSIPCPILLQEYSLHSTMYLFLQDSTLYIDKEDFPLHSTMYLFLL